MLAIEVLLFHLVGLPVIGRFAVFSFFVLSGYVITAIMHRTYGYTASGRLYFAQNRALRLLPTYWIAAVFSIAVILWVGPDVAHSYHYALAIPRTARAIFENATMLFVNHTPLLEVPRLSPPTWALTTEIFYYVVICIGASRTRLVTWLWLAASVAYLAAAWLIYGTAVYFYDPIPAGSFPFAIGALTYHYRDEVARIAVRAPRGAVGLVAARWLLAAAVFAISRFTDVRDSEVVGNLINALLSSLVVGALINGSRTPARAKLDKALGELSYPIYLFHWPVGLLVSTMLFGAPVKGPTTEGIVAGLSTLLATLGIAFVCNRTIDQLIERYRDVIRAKSVRQKDRVDLGGELTGQLAEAR